MEGEGYTYVNGEGQYRGNILLDPQGTPTRAEMYDAIAEVSRPVTITEQASPWGIGLGMVACAILFVIACYLAGILKRLS